MPVHRPELPERAEGPKKQRVEAKAEAVKPAEDKGQTLQETQPSRGQATTWSNVYPAAANQNDAHPSTERKGLHEYVAPAPVTASVEAQHPADPPTRRIFWLDYSRDGAEDQRPYPDTTLPRQSSFVAERGPGEFSDDQSRRTGGPPQALKTSSLMVMDAEPARPSLAIDGPLAAIDGPPLPIPFPVPNQPPRVSTPVQRHHDLIFDDEEASDPDSGPHYFNQCKQLLTRLNEEYGPRHGEQYDINSDGHVSIYSTPGKVFECPGYKVKLWAPLTDPDEEDRNVRIYGNQELRRSLNKLAAELGTSYPMYSDGVRWRFCARKYISLASFFPVVLGSTTTY